MQGIYIDGRRPKSKKQVREHIKEHPLGGGVTLEATSMFGNEYGGRLDEAPHNTYYVVGPDPYTSRKFYLNLEWKNGKWKVK